MNFMNWLRWLVFLPIAVVVYSISYRIAFGIITFVLDLIGLMKFNIVFYLTAILINPIATYLYMMVGLNIVPNKYFIASVILTMLYTGYYGTVLIASFLNMPVSDAPLWTWAATALSGLVICLKFQQVDRNRYFYKGEL